MWIFYALAAAILWGMDYALAERVMHHKISPTSMLAAQMLVGALVFGLISAQGAWRSDMQILAQDPAALRVSIAALFAFTVGNLFIALSIKAKNATLAGLIEISYPIFIAIFSWLLFGQNNFSLSTIVGGGLIFSGVGIIYLYS